MICCVQGQKKQDRTERKNLLKEKKQLKEEEKLISIIKVREILLEFRLQNLLQSRGVCLLNDSLTSQHQPPGEGIVHINDNGELVWPVMFLYPEYGQCDYIMAFNENSRYVFVCVCVFLFVFVHVYTCA